MCTACRACCAHKQINTEEEDANNSLLRVWWGGLDWILECYRYNNESVRKSKTQIEYFVVAWNGYAYVLA